MHQRAYNGGYLHGHLAEVLGEDHGECVAINGGLDGEPLGVPCTALSFTAIWLKPSLKCVLFAPHQAAGNKSPSSNTNCLIFVCCIIVAFLWFLTQQLYTKNSRIEQMKWLQLVAKSQ